ncbi:MAG: hypothetical protein HQK65_17050 [Desulfamplus sp.]|nr:hypothetical protein [Desulfamplus sp.]
MLENEAEIYKSEGETVKYDAIKDYIQQISNFGELSNVLKAARSIKGFVASPFEFDCDDHLINVQNGIVNLTTAELLSHDPSYKMMQIADVEYNKEAKSQLWSTFLDDITNRDKALQEYIKRAMGYAATGYTKEQVLFIFIGNGANGKTTVQNVHKVIFGDYAKVTPTKTLLAAVNKGINADEARLAGSRYVIATEVNINQRLDEAKVKALTGGDTITARHLRENYFQYTPKLTLFMGVNHLPIVSGDDAIFRRIRVIPFNAKFEGEKLNRDLEVELLKDREAIFAWVVEGAVKWHLEGLGTCDAVDRAILSYRNESNIINEFFNETIVEKEGERIPKGVLYDMYKIWADKNVDYTMSKNGFGSFMKRRGVEEGKSGSTRLWKGITLKIWVG